MRRLVVSAALVSAGSLAFAGFSPAAADPATSDPRWSRQVPPVQPKAQGAHAGHGARPPSQGAGAPQGAQGAPSAQGALPAAGPVASDFVDIRTVRPNFRRPRTSAASSTGIFINRCGRNERGQHNSDNVIVAPGVVNGAHHTHDYVGNTTTSGLSTDQSLASAGTTCVNGDRSTHYWPVVRMLGRFAANSADPALSGNGQDGNNGRILTPATVTLKFSGNPTSKVTAMPRFLRIITGDAKASTNGGANAHAQWTCTGFENRRLTDKYPLCPRGSKVTRILDFQSCWNGTSVDSVNHRTHVAYTAATGACPAGMRAIPALQQRITYNIPPGTMFALDSFPEQFHKPVTDHGDFINVMSGRLMNRVVRCINTGANCR